ncbi:MAG: type II 3-dehydroquinate dehydratase [Rhodospirillales bacterium]
MRPRFLVLNGPNLNLLGEREPHIYGAATLADVESMCRQRAEAHGGELRFHQSNHEGELVDWVQEARQSADALIINPGAYSHTSIALLDALLALTIPIFEVHISNIFRREAFRQHSYVSSAARGVICGLGVYGYELAVEAAAHALQRSAAITAQQPG